MPRSVHDPLLGLAGRKIQRDERRAQVMGSDGFALLRLDEQLGLVPFDASGVQVLAVALSIVAVGRPRERTSGFVHEQEPVIRIIVLFA